MNKTERAYAALRGRILQGTYAPGQRLILATLAAELGVSSVPVREALRRLEAEGWVTFKPNIGAEVRPVDATEWVAVMDTLAVNEGHATAMAAPLMTSEDIERARAINSQMRSALERMDPLAASDANRTFHEVLCARCPNAHMLSVIQQANERLNAMRRTVFVFVPARTIAAVDEHDQLLAMIEADADPEDIERFAREHKLHTVIAYLTRENGAESPALGDGAGLISAALLASSESPSKQPG